MQLIPIEQSKISVICQVLSPRQKMLQNPQLLNFLKKENNCLREEVKDLKQLLAFNRQAMRVSIQFKSGNQAALPPLVKLLYQENTKLLTKLNQMKLELQNGLCKALVSQQIAFASTQHQKYMTIELKSKLAKLKKELQMRDNKIIQIQKNKPSVDQKMNDIKIVQISQPNIQNMKLKNDIQVLHQEIHRKKQQIEKLRDTREQLIRLNLLLSKQISQLKALSLVESTKSKNEDLKPTNSGQISRFLNYQKRIMDGDHDHMQGQENSNGDSQLDQNESSIDQDGEQFQDDIEDHNQTFTHQPQKVQVSRLNMTKMGQVSKLGLTKVPKLQLTKAKQIQQLIVKKINNDQKKKAGATVKQEKFKKVENQLAQTRKKLGKVLIQKITQQRENNFLRKIVKQLQDRNMMLIQQRMMTQAQTQYMKRYEEGQQTLIDICRDVTMNEKLRQVLEGRQEIFTKKGLISNQV